MVCPRELSKRAQNNSDGGFGLGREVAVNQVIRLQFPDQIVFEVVEANLDPALLIVFKLRGKLIQLLLQSFGFGAGSGLRFQYFNAGQEVQRTGLGAVINNHCRELAENIHWRTVNPGLSARQ